MVSLIVKTLVWNDWALPLRITMRRHIYYDRLMLKADEVSAALKVKDNPKILGGYKYINHRTQYRLIIQFFCFVLIMRCGTQDI